MSTTTAPDGALRLETVSATVPGTPTRSPARQALGELTPNTRRALPGAGVGFEKKLLAAATSPVKPTLLRGAGAENALGLVIPHAGRKRAFHEVDGVFAGERDATRVRVEAEVAGGVAAGTATSAAPLGDSTMADYVDEAELSPTEADSPLSRIMDDEHNAETGEKEGWEQHSCGNTPRMSKADDDAAEQASFSSLVNYDPRGSSQDAQSPPDCATAAVAAAIAETSIKSQVEMLRLRLRMAMYKIRTNQTTTPLPDLRLSASGQGLSAGATTEPPRPADREDGEGADRTTPKAPRISAPSLLPPAPILLPTAHSARTIAYTRPAPSPPSDPRSSSDQAPAQRTTQASPNAAVAAAAEERGDAQEDAEVRPKEAERESERERERSRAEQHLAAASIAAAALCAPLAPPASSGPFSSRWWQVGK